VRAETFSPLKFYTLFVNEFRAIHALCFEAPTQKQIPVSADGIVSIDLRIVPPEISPCQGFSVTRITRKSSRHRVPCLEFPQNPAYYSHARTPPGIHPSQLCALLARQKPSIRFKQLIFIDLEEFIRPSKDSSR
jgi:hypothetical protein